MPSIFPWLTVNGYPHIQDSRHSKGHLYRGGKRHRAAMQAKFTKRYGRKGKYVYGAVVGAADESCSSTPEGHRRNAPDAERWFRKDWKNGRTRARTAISSSTGT
jgi:hypothetical protein